MAFGTSAGITRSSTNSKRSSGGGGSSLHVFAPTKSKKSSSTPTSFRKHRHHRGGGTRVPDPNNKNNNSNEDDDDDDDDLSSSSGSSIDLDLMTDYSSSTNNNHAATPVSTTPQKQSQQQQQQQQQQLRRGSLRSNGMNAELLEGNSYLYHIRGNHHHHSPEQEQAPLFVESPNNKNNNKSPNSNHHHHHHKTSPRGGGKGLDDTKSSSSSSSSSSMDEDHAGGAAAAAVYLIPRSNLHLTSNNNNTVLYDREKELRLLRDEYSAMIQRARRIRHASHHNNKDNDYYHDDAYNDHDEVWRSHKNLTSVICVAGKAGSGKTALVRTFATQVQALHQQAHQQQQAQRAHQQQQQAHGGMSSHQHHPHQYHPREAYVLYGKFHWPTSSMTSSLPARPYEGQQAQNKNDPQSPTNYNTTIPDQGQHHHQHHHEPLAPFCRILNQFVELLQQHANSNSRNKIRTRILHAIGNPATHAASIAVLGELSPRLAEFLKQHNPNNTSSSVRSDMTASTSSSQLFDDHHHHPDTNSTVGESYSGSSSIRSSSMMGSGGGAASIMTTMTKKFIHNHYKTIPVEHRMTRLKYLMRQLFRAICDKRNPCVMILDDVQWADPEALELAQYLHADVENPWFMLIVTWRTNDIHEEEACYTAVGSTIGLFADDLVRRINLQNMSLDATTLMVAEALQMPASDSNIRDLARMVLAKTFGNPFFVRQFLQYLEQDRLLLCSNSSRNTMPPQDETITDTITTTQSSSLSSSLWSWDITRIAPLDTSWNFVDLVTLQLRRLPLPCVVVLQIVSCLGPTFDEDYAAIILDRMDTMEMFDCDITQSSALAYIQALVTFGYLERYATGQQQYNNNNNMPTTATTTITSFAHDQIQEAAFQLIPKATRPLLQLRVGERLLEIMEEQQGSEDAAADVNYLGVDLCSKGIAFLSTKERMGLALYNLLAGEKCLARASFSTALAYFEYGLTSALRVGDFLKGRLSLELSFGAMEAAFGVDDMEHLQLHYDRITGSASAPEDKIRAHCVLIRAFGTHGNFKEAIATGYRVLRSIGVKTIMEMSNKVSLYVHLRKTKIALRKYHSEEALANIRELNGGTKLRQAMRIIEAMLPFAYQHDVQLFWLLVFKAARWSVKYGVSGQSAFVFAALGSFPAFQAMDMRLATALGQASLRLLQRFGSCDYPGLVLFLSHSQILNWTLDPAIIQRHLEMTYRISMETGDALSASCSLVAAYATAYESGRISLDVLESQGQKHGLRLKETKSESIVAIHNATWQTVLNLRGDSYHISELTGRAMNQDEALLTASASRNELLEFTILSRQMQLCYFMGEHVRADALRQRSEATLRSVASSPWVVAHVAYAALNCLALCASYCNSSIRKNTHYKTAGKLYKKLNAWQDDQGYRFCGHLIKLVQAEFSRVNGKDALTEQNLEAACYAAGRLGNLRDKGLAYELAGRFYARDRGHEARASTHFDQAIQSYHAWGAIALVNKVVDEHGDVVSRNPGISELSRQLLLSQNSENNLV